MATRAKIEKNLQQVRERIAEACARARRSPAEVTLVAVTKTAELEQLQALLDLGVTDLAESRVPQLVERTEALAKYAAAKKLPPPRWHLIGHLQRNKVKTVLETGDLLIHSVDSLRLAEELDERGERLGRVVSALMEVNCSMESQKFGLAVGAAAHLGDLLGNLKHLRVVGLMTMAAQSPNPEDARATFVRLREIFEEMQHAGIGGPQFTHLSMGMSQDYEVAIEEGATLVRVGTALFA